ncbi:PREDICTED: uncharacterized protein LOC101815660 [Ficedula albicollis]|uniref:uncharacterized protein LOC101815660 n=1 Tax=Ficedula albicollis TaxID=59894 RepID=UPI00035A2169|nr:PREDICTED: uncharacterized protein LOC101815660 [Ficedula albicollis]
MSQPAGRHRSPPAQTQRAAPPAPLIGPFAVRNQAPAAQRPRGAARRACRRAPPPGLPSQGPRGRSRWLPKGWEGWNSGSGLIPPSLQPFIPPSLHPPRRSIPSSSSSLHPPFIPPSVHPIRLQSLQPIRPHPQHLPAPRPHKCRASGAEFGDGSASGHLETNVSFSENKFQIKAAARRGFVGKLKSPPNLWPGNAGCGRRKSVEVFPICFRHWRCFPLRYLGPVPPPIHYFHHSLLTEPRSAIQVALEPFAPELFKLALDQNPRDVAFSSTGGTDKRLRELSYTWKGLSLSLPSLQNERVTRPASKPAPAWASPSMGPQILPGACFSADFHLLQPSTSSGMGSFIRWRMGSSNRWTACLTLVFT